MKSYFFFIFKILIALVLTAFLLDVCYTNIYKHAKPRFKFQYLMSLKDKHVDYIFIGSSRVENSIIPSRIEKRNGSTALNIGFQAGKINDIILLIKMVKELNISYKKIFIQIDYNYNLKKKYSNILEYELMPYLQKYDRLQNYIAKSSPGNYFNLNYLPFYRYSYYSQKIGIRELFAQIIHKESKVIKEKGYVKLITERDKNEKYSLPSFILKTNEEFDSLDAFCKQNNIPVTYYIAPFYKSVKGLNFIVKLKSRIPNIIDLSSVIKDSNCFADSAHLNDKGAIKFTDYCIAKFKL